MLSYASRIAADNASFIVHDQKFSSKYLSLFNVKLKVCGYSCVSHYDPSRSRCAIPGHTHGWMYLRKTSNMFAKFNRFAVIRTLNYKTFSQQQQKYKSNPKVT